MSFLAEKVSQAASKLGMTVSRTSSLQHRLPIEATEDDRQVINKVRPFTMTSTERIWALLQAVDYLEKNSVQGDFVECGVWRGGSVMAMALRLQQLKAKPRRIWLYDTFEGMTPPTNADVDAVAGITAAQLLATTQPADGDNVWCIANQPDVQRNLAITNYPSENLTFVVGDVSETLRAQVPEKIALLRLDTDWYESTKSELEVLYPKLVIGGVCILDDYGHWQGARKAVDDYFADNAARPLLMPVDFSGRIFIKTHD